MTVAAPIKPHRPATFDGITISTASKPAYIMTAIAPSPKGVVISYDENWNHEGEVPTRNIEMNTKSAHKMFRTMKRNQDTIKQIGNGFWGNFKMMGKTKYFTHAVHVSPAMMDEAFHVIAPVISPKKDAAPTRMVKQSHIMTANASSIGLGTSA